MAGILSATGLYKLTGVSPVDMELDAYGAGLGLIEADMALLEAELFVMTAPGDRLREWEKLFRWQASSGELEDRRRGVAKALGAWQGEMSLAAIADILDIAGVRGEATYADGKITVTASGFMGVTEREAKRLLDRLLPAHLEWELVKE